MCVERLWRIVKVAWRKDFMLLPNKKITQSIVHRLIHYAIEHASSFHLRMHIKTCTKLMCQWLDHNYLKRAKNVEQEEVRPLSGLE